MNWPRIDGGSADQIVILREILAGIGSTRVAAVALHPFVRAVESDAELEIGEPGLEIAVSTTPEDDRGLWEAGLLARAFARRSQRMELPKVIWFRSGHSGRTLDHIGRASTRLPRDAIDRFRKEIASATAEGSIEWIDILQPGGHAFALSVRVEEPHSFLRSRSPAFLASLSKWRSRCEGIYAQIRDARSTPVLTVSWFQDGGAASVRRDVECCAPSLGLSRGIGVDSPSCPVFS